jgi:4-hydroxy-3-methylbut-2-enyl diphosphate reductase
VYEKNVPSPVHTLGPLIHNRLVLEELEKKGVTQIDSVEEIEEGTVIVRAHGIKPEVRKQLEGKGVTLVDATCPLVQKSQEIVETYSQRGYHIIIVGDKNHGEVQGLAGFAQRYTVISTPEEAQIISLPSKVLVIGQTTIRREEYHRIAEIIKSRGQDVEIHDSICDSVEKRQKALRSLAAEVDALLVIGGKNSANTKNLFRSAQQLNKPVWHIESADEIPQEITRYERIGLSAGASTPDWVIDEIEVALEDGRQ